MRKRQRGRLSQPQGLWSPVAVLQRPSKHTWRCSAATRRSRVQKRSLTSRLLTSPHDVRHCIVSNICLSQLCSLVATMRVSVHGAHPK